MITREDIRLILSHVPIKSCSDMFTFDSNLRKINKSCESELTYKDRVGMQ